MSVAVPQAGPFGLRRRRPGLPELAARLAAALPLGVRVGESAVVSTQVHLLNPRDPDCVSVLTDRDAGQVFYGRRGLGEIVHLDVFHAVADVDCHRVAAAVLDAVEAYRGEFAPPSGGPAADYFDLQTGSGGGRATGLLQSGRRASLRAAHRNHVHLAGRLAPGDVACCFYLVAAVELTLASAGVEVRRVDRVLARGAGEAGAPQDLSPYSAVTDTLLREDGPPGRPGAPRGEESLLAAAVRLADEWGGVEAVRLLLDALQRPLPLQEVRAPGWTPPRIREAAGRLAQDGWLESAGGLWQLSPAGVQLHGVFRRRLREVELAMRAAARRVAVTAARGVTSPGAKDVPSPRGKGRQPIAWCPGQRLGDLCLSETVVCALARQPRPFGLRTQDIRIQRRLRPRRVDLCLLLDASASMEGSRMRAAKTLARHLLLTSRDRVAVMAFQERGALLAVPFTRNYTAAERGLGRIQPAGLTPLAAGLAAARDYLRASHARNPLLLLVTDGIPTVSAGGGSPLDEALVEAERIGGLGLALACIGLEPNERYLAELARRAGGSLHVVSELRPDVLARVARLERMRHREG